MTSLYHFERDKTLPASELKERFRYDDKTGKLHWRDRFGGKEAGSLVAGRRLVKLLGRKWMVHRLIFRMLTGNWPTGELISRDGDYANTRIENLVEISRSANRAKGRCGMKPKSGYRGVVIGPGPKARAYVTIQGKFTYLGMFGSVELASEVVEARCKLRDGPYYTNPNKVKP